MGFDKSALEKLYSNVERVEGKPYPNHYAIVDQLGSTVAQVVFQGGNEMCIEVDNFPGEKQYYSSSIPCRSIYDFEGDLKRVGIELKPVPVEIHIESVEPLTGIKRFTENNGSPIVETEHKTGKEDILYDEAVRSVIEANRASIAFIQRKLRIGYNRAAQLIEAMEVEGVVSVASNTGVRTVIAKFSP